MTEKDTSKKSTWEKLNIAAKQDTSKTSNEEKVASAEKGKAQSGETINPSFLRSTRSSVTGDGKST